MSAVKTHHEVAATKENSGAGNAGAQGSQLPAVPALQLAAEKTGNEPVQDQPVTIQKKENKTGLPDNLKSGVEQLSGLSMDDTRVHYNSEKPAQLNAFAYAQGNNIHVAPGQEKHLPHEAWHVAQQKQGRVKPTLQMKAGIPVNDDAGLEEEADIMGSKAAQLSAYSTTATSLTGAQPGNEDVVQGVFIFQVNIDNYTIFNTKYYRVQQIKYLTGNSEFKHVTADSVKDALWKGMEGMSLQAFARRLMHISDEYLQLPGLELLETHKLADEDNPIYHGLNQAMIENSATFDKVMEDLPRQSSELGALIQTFDLAELSNNVQGKNSAAFLIQNKALSVIDTLDKFRDLMPLVNIISGIQKGGQEKEAKAFLKDGTTTKNIDNNFDALWAFFDFAAISELADVDESEMLKNIKDALPWINTKALLDLAADKVALANGTEPAETGATVSDMLDTVAIMMLSNHIRLIKLSYPDAAKACNFDSVESVFKALKDHETPVNRELVAQFAILGW